MYQAVISNSSFFAEVIVDLPFAWVCRAHLVPRSLALSMLRCWHSWPRFSSVQPFFAGPKTCFSAFESAWPCNQRWHILNDCPIQR